jgi:hypothetical protein
MNSFLTDYNFNTSKNVILSKCSILMLLRYAHKGMEDIVLQNGSVRKVARMDDRTNLLPRKSNANLRKNFWFPKVMKVHEDILERLSSLFLVQQTPPHLDVTIRSYVQISQDCSEGQQFLSTECWYNFPCKIVPFYNVLWCILHMARKLIESTFTPNKWLIIWASH